MPASSTTSTSEPRRVLVAEDTDRIAELVSSALRFDGYEVEVVGDGHAALTRIAAWKPHLVLLDIMMPGLDGFAVQRALAQEDDPPAVIVVSARDETVDLVRGLDLGAEDYVTKPFKVEELLARVRAVLRRVTPASASTVPREGGGERFSFHDLELDEDTHEVRRAGELVELTPREFELLRYLLANAGIVLTKSQILDAVWQYDFGGDQNIVETYVSYLRRKLDNRDPRLIHTVRGVGYTIRLPRNS